MIQNASELIDIKHNSNDESFDIVAYQVKQYNSMKVASDYPCDKCNGSGKLAFINEFHQFAFKNCECYKKKYAFQKLKKLGLIDFLKKASCIEELPENEEWEKAVKSKLDDYIKNHRNIFWVFIGGQVGTGKTTKATLILKYLIEQNDMRDFEFLNWGAEYKKLVFSKDRDALVKDLQEVDILFIDDFFRHQNGDMLEREREVAMEIIDYRYRKKKQTIITSELHLTELSGFDEAIGSRIYQMCGKDKYTIQIARDSKRNYRTKGMSKII